MVQIQITDGYWTGNYAEIGGIEGGIEVSAIPDEPDTEKRRAYKLQDGALALDADKWEEIRSDADTASPTDSERIAALEAANAELRAAIEALISGDTGEAV